MDNRLLTSLRRTFSFLSHPRLTALSQPDVLFLALAIPFGFIFIFLSAPFQAPDEHVHFYRAYAISTGQFTGAKVSLPESVYEFSITVSKDLPGNDQNKQSKVALVQELFRPFTAQPTVDISIMNSAIVSPAPYLPQALGILLGRLAHLQPILIFYLGRIFNFLVWLGLTFLAIKITPLHPRLFVALALMPMTLHQAASNSPDAATIAITFLFIAFALRILMDQQAIIKGSDWVKIAFLTVVMTLCKSVYILPVGLLLAVPLRRFKQQRSSLTIVLGIIGLGLACGLAWLMYSSQFVSVEMMNTLKTPTTGSIVYILQHPLVVAPLFWHATVTNLGDQMRMFVGVLGWLDTVLPAWVYPLYFGLLFFTVILEPHPQAYFHIVERIWIVALAIIASVLMLAIFFYPNPATGDMTMAVPQGRYYLPFGALYFLPFSQRKWSIPQDSPAWVVTSLLHALVLLVTVRVLVWRYYAI
jgi:uncharacterized membrane protein